MSRTIEYKLRITIDDKQPTGLIGNVLHFGRLIIDEILASFTAFESGDIDLSPITKAHRDGATLEFTRVSFAQMFK